MLRLLLERRDVDEEGEGVAVQKWRIRWGGQDLLDGSLRLGEAAEEYFHRRVGEEDLWGAAVNFNYLLVDVLRVLGVILQPQKHPP